MKPVVLFLVVVFSLASRAREPESMVKTEIVTLALHDAVDGLFMWNGEKVVPFRSVPGGISPPVAYTGPATLVLHKTPGGFLNPDPPVAPVTTVPLPEGADRVLILVNKTGQGPLRLRALAVPFDSFRNGDYRVLNFSNREVRIRLGNENLTIPSGRSETLVNESWRTTTQDLNVMVGAQAGSEMKVYTSVWGHRNSRRTFLFIFDGETPEDPVMIRRVHDRAP